MKTQKQKVRNRFQEGAMEEETQIQKKNFYECFKTPTSFSEGRN
jgi:hypothetical protein